MFCFSSPYRMIPLHDKNKRNKVEGATGNHSIQGGISKNSLKISHKI